MWARKNLLQGYSNRQNETPKGKNGTYNQDFTYSSVFQFQSNEDLIESF